MTNAAWIGRSTALVIAVQVAQGRVSNVKPARYRAFTDFETLGRLAFLEYLLVYQLCALEGQIVKPFCEYRLREVSSLNSNRPIPHIGRSRRSCEPTAY